MGRYRATLPSGGGERGDGSIAGGGAAHASGAVPRTGRWFGRGRAARRAEARNSSLS